MITKTISCVLIETYYSDHNTIERKEGEREKKNLIWEILEKLD